MKGHIQNLVNRLKQVISAITVRVPFCISYDSNRVPSGHRPEAFSSLEEYYKDVKKFGEDRLADWFKGLSEEHRQALVQDPKPLRVFLVPKKSISAEQWIKETLEENLESLIEIKKRIEDEQEDTE